MVISTMEKNKIKKRVKKNKKESREWLGSGKGATLNTVLGKGFAEVTFEPKYARLDKDRAVYFGHFWISHSLWLVNWEIVQKRKKMSWGEQPLEIYSFFPPACLKAIKNPLIVLNPMC